MAKLFGSEVSTKVTEQCIQFLGGHGLDKDHPVERFYRETKLFQVGDGSSEMLSILISRHLNKQAQAGMHARLACQTRMHARLGLLIKMARNQDA